MPGNSIPVGDQHVVYISILCGDVSSVIFYYSTRGYAVIKLIILKDCLYRYYYFFLSSCLLVVALPSCELIPPLGAPGAPGAPSLGGVLWMYPSMLFGPLVSVAFSLLSMSLLYFLVVF